MKERSKRNSIKMNRDRKRQNKKVNSKSKESFKIKPKKKMNLQHRSNNWVGKRKKNRIKNEITHKKLKTIWKIYSNCRTKKMFKNYKKIKRKLILR